MISSPSTVLRLPGASSPRECRPPLPAADLDGRYRRRVALLEGRYRRLVLILEGRYRRLVLLLEGRYGRAVAPTAG